ncbi:MAG: hypothetical protein ACLGHN_12175 [Bacteriovoracia bacterium]
MKYLNCFLLLILISCSNGEVRQAPVDSPYRTSGLEQYFLPELPTWANSSASGQCFKRSPFQYLEFPKLNITYQLEYQELVELQAQYNERLEAYFRSTAVRFLKPVEQAAFFTNTLENVRGGVRSFKIPPEAKKVDIIWLDRYVALNLVSELSKMNEMGRFDERVPVLFTSCFSKQDLNQWLIENNLDQVGFYSITAEWLSPFGSDLQIKPGLQIEVKKLLGPDKDVRFVAPSEILLPTEIVL